MRLDEASSAPISVWKRAGWFVLIWVASVAVLLVVAYVLRLWLKAG